MLKDFLNPIIFQHYKMPLIVIYKNPEDFPGKYVARLFDMDRATSLHIVKDSMKEIIETIPAHMTFMRRNEADDPCIVGSYI